MGGEISWRVPYLFMPRKSRELVAGGVYHVFARGNRRQLIFNDDHDRRQYLAIWGSVAQELRWRCLSYCLMDNHVHHLVETPEPNLSEGVQLAHGMYARHVNHAFSRDGHLFQGRFGSSRAESPGAVWYLASYIALNPVRAGICASPGDFAWSSHAAVLEEARRPPWLDTHRLLSFYGNDGKAAVDRYVQIVDAVQALGAAGFEPGVPGLSART